MTGITNFPIVRLKKSGFDYKRINHYKGYLLDYKTICRHRSHSTLEQVLDYEGLVFQHRTRTKEHYEAVCQTLEQIKSFKR